MLATACLEAPPGATDPGTNDDGGGGGSDAGADGIGFPPTGAVVHLSGALSADVDNDGRGDLVLLDDDPGDEFVGVYVLRAGQDGWAALDEVKLGFAPTAASFGRKLKPTQALLVGGPEGQVAVVDYKQGADYQVQELTLDPALTGPVKIVDSGIVGATDETASLMIYDGASLWRSGPVDVGGTTPIGALSSGTFLDASFWPLDSNNQTNYIAARSEDELEWHLESSGSSVIFETALAARFGHLVNGMCGTHLVVGADDSLSIGSISCGGAMAALDPLLGSDIPQVKAMMAADLGGSAKHDVVLIGLDGDALYGQALIDINYVAGEAPSFEPDATTVPIPIEVALPATFYLVAADVDGDDSEAVYLIAPSGAGFCGQLQATDVVPCAREWQLKAP